MQSSNPQRREAEQSGNLVGLVVTVGRHGTRLSAVLLWIAVGGYVWLWPVVALPYTVGVVGWSVGVALIAMLLGNRSNAYSGGLRAQSRRHSWLDRALLVGCLLGIVGGTIWVRSITQLTTSQPSSLTGVLAGTLVVASLFVLVGRLYRPLVAGLAVVAIGVAWLAVPDGSSSLIETMVFSSGGIYGPLTRAAATWIASACLLVGLWRATGTVDLLRALIPEPELSNSGWLAAFVRHNHRPQQLTLSSIGFVTLLIAWQSGRTGSLMVIGATAIPVAFFWLTGQVVVDSAEYPSSSPEWTRRWQAWSGLLLLAGGPSVLMAVLLIGFRQPLGTVLVGGCLFLAGLCTLGPLTTKISSVDNELRPTENTQGGLRTGFRTLLDGSVLGVTYLARVIVLLAVVGGVVSALQAVGVSTWLVSTMLWLSAGQTILVFLVFASVCVGLGLVLPMIGGYAVGALLVVPLLQTLTPVSELTAHLLVWYAVVGGGVVGPGLRTRVQNHLAVVVRHLT